ncbi:MAG: insulinase family protein [Oscillospiraceae bacterium]|jgi:predicted Zn-dependent peptidase|nr:insulinase family protein [Oscillospiraceae bacterium]
MSQQFERAVVGKQVHFSHIPDPKFKHNLISANFIMPLRADTASDNAVVPYILRKGCRTCPDFSALNAKLSALYGATMNTGVSRINGYQILSVSIRALDSRFALENEDIVSECASLLASVVLDPKLDSNGFFDEKDTALERQFIIDSIQSEINDKRTYAISRCMQTMCEGEPVAVRRYGDLATAEKITPESAYNAYRNMLDTANIEVIFTGSGKPDAAKKIFSEAFCSKTRNAPDYRLIPLRTSADTVRETTERMTISQSKLVMGLRTGAPQTDEELFAMRLCSALLGGTPFSKLFLNVREKLSLCYYCAANFDMFNRTLIIDSGIEAQNKQKAQDEILRQIKAIQDNDFMDDELANTKLLVKNALTTATDSPASMESWYLSQTMRGRSRAPGEEAGMLEAVTREQIVSAAKKISLDTIYFLTGNEQEAQA